ncbi:MAG: bifunctional DNA primase/polymerase [Nanoarchaeota archaeon]
MATQINLDKNSKRQLQSFIIPYLQKNITNFSMERNRSMFTCPECKQLSASLFPPTSYNIRCYTPGCGEKGNIGDIFDLSRKLDFNNDKNLTEQDIAEYLIIDLKIKITGEINSLLEKYQKWGWSLFPVVKDTKTPAQKGWTEKTHKDINEWQGWVNNSSGLGVKCGKDSNVIGIDIDLITKEEAEIWQMGTATKTIEEIITKKETNLKKLKELNLFPDTVTQDSGWKGIHFFYQYDVDIPKSSFNYEGLHFDIQSDGGYILVEPSSYKGKGRIIKGDIIQPLSPETKKFLLEHIKKPSDLKVEDVIIPEGSEGLKNLDGNRNNTFISLMGQFRKYMPLENVERSAHLISQQFLERPMPAKEIKAMVQQIDKYHSADIDTIGEKILEHLKIVDVAHIKDIKECLGFDRKDLEKSIKNLLDIKKIYKIKKDLYQILENTVWREDFLNTGKPLGFKVPYFENVAHFDSGSMIVIGAVSGTGKTVLSMNWVDQFVKQNICPYLISTEAGSKFGKTAQALGLKESDFKFIVTNDPSKISFPKNSVVIVDWLKAKNSEYQKTETLYESFNDKLVENGGLLIIFAQLKRETKLFYAEDMVSHFGALVAKFLYPQVNGVEDNSKPYFKTEKIRDSKTNQQYLTIPLQYNYDTKIVSLK